MWSGLSNGTMRFVLHHLGSATRVFNTRAIVFVSESEVQKVPTFLAAIYFQSKHHANHNRPQPTQMSTLVLDYNGFNTSAWIFAADLLAKVLERPNNICLSPLSVQTCFALIAEAADGDTKKQLMDVFKFPTDYLNQFSDIIHSIDQSEATIKIANSFWLNDKFKLDKEFMTKILQIFKDAEGSECNFNSEEQRAKWVLKINSWVRQKTTGHIQKIIQHIDSGSTLLLVNAVYFDGIWKSAFKAENTVKNAKFRALDSKTVFKTEMMTQQAKFKFLQHCDFKAVKLPYEGDDTCLYAILPSKYGKEPLDRLLSSEFLTEFLTRHKEEMKQVTVNIKFPKFKFVNDYDMVPILKSLGLEDIFDERIADLKKLVVGKSEGLSVTQTVHKTFFELDEEMAKASAVALEDEDYDELLLERSRTKTKKRGRQRKEVIEEFTVDRPFAFVVYHHQTQQILFLGKIVDPTHKGDNDKKRAANTADNEQNDEHVNKKQK